MSEAKAHSTSSGAVVGQEAGLILQGGIFRKLVDEHGEAAQLMMKVRAATDAESRHNLYPALRTALLGHERTESSILYAELKRYPDTQQIVEKHEQEAQRLEATIRTLDTIEITNEAWLPRFIELCALVQSHVREEEDELFIAAFATLGESASDDLRVAYLRAKPGFVNRVEAESPLQE